MLRQIYNRFRSGSGTMLFGVFFMVTFFAFIMMFAEMYSMQDNYLNTKAAADTIADGTALYAMENQDAGYDAVSRKATEIASVLDNELGINVGAVSTSASSLSDDTIEISTNANHQYLTGMFLSDAYGLSTTSGTKYNVFSLEGIQHGVPPAALSNEAFREMLTVAETQLGVTYSFGASTPGVALDCSSFVSYVLTSTFWPGLAGDTQTLYMACTYVSPEEAQPGDLVFFKDTYNSGHIDGVSHVGIYCGGGVMIHCGHPVQYAAVSSMGSHFLAYGRLPNASSIFGSTDG